MNEEDVGTVERPTLGGREERRPYSDGSPALKIRVIIGSLTP